MPSMAIPGVDMNDAANLSNYHDILLFKSVNYEDALVFSNPDRTNQRVIQAIAHSLDLEYEYTLATRNASVTRRRESDEREGPPTDIEDDSIHRVDDENHRSRSQGSDRTIDMIENGLFHGRNHLISPDGTNQLGSTASPEPRPFQCKHPRCNYQGTSQRLLDRHIERNHVNDESRLFFCPVKGCPRSRDGGGKGFKYKYNIELHEYTHNSPGYICPFCIEEVRKFNRPDVLSKHVQSKHGDKRMGDPVLAKILAARPNGFGITEAADPPDTADTADTTDMADAADTADTADSTEQ